MVEGQADFKMFEGMDTPQKAKKHRVQLKKNKKKGKLQIKVRTEGIV